MNISAINQLIPEVMGICINLNCFPWSVSASRLYMLGSQLPKAVPIEGRTTRRITTGFEKQYSEGVRSVVAPANMTVAGIFYQKSTIIGETIDDWNEIYVVYYNDESQKFDLLVLPKYNVQNFYVVFEYKFDMEVMRKLAVGATYSKGTVFALSPSISESKEWCFGLETMVCGMTHPATEEDGIVVTDRFIERIATSFEHVRNFEYNETEYVPLNLYGTKDKPRPFPENGERIRSDGIVMGFRRRDTSSALVSLTKKALMRPDLTYDVLFYAPRNCEVKSIEVKSERYKNRSNNKSAEKISQPHTKVLEQYETANNSLNNEIKTWYFKTTHRYQHGEVPMSPQLTDFVFKGIGNVTKDYSTGKYQFVKRTNRNKHLNDWNIVIKLKERIKGRVRFKLTSTNGGKGVIVKIIPWQHAPVDAHGVRAEIIVNNTPAFRRQIFSELLEASVNFINEHIHREVKKLIALGKYNEAWKELFDFYETFSPEFAEILNNAQLTDSDKFEHVDYVAKNQISVHKRSDSKLFGADIIRALNARYPNIKPTPVTYVNDLGETVTTDNPVIISSMYYMMLDKFGTDMSCQSISKLSLFGMPAKLNKGDKYRTWHRDQPNRNKGEPEAKLTISQAGGQETVKQLACANSPKVSEMITKRIIRADNPFRIKQIVKPEEYKTNRALHFAMGSLSDSGFTLRSESESDY